MTLPNTAPEKQTVKLAIAKNQPSAGPVLFSASSPLPVVQVPAIVAHQAAGTAQDWFLQVGLLPGTPLALSFGGLSLRGGFVFRCALVAGAAAARRGKWPRRERCLCKAAGVAVVEVLGNLVRSSLFLRRRTMAVDAHIPAFMLGACEPVPAVSGFQLRLPRRLGKPIGLLNCFLGPPSCHHFPSEFLIILRVVLPAVDNALETD
jgi:hypothetical protein